jgi:hypothetical protein
MVTCNLNLGVQILSIVAGAFGVAVGLHNAIRWPHTLVVSIFTIIFGLLVILVEVYVLPQFKYIAFLLTMWGKAATYLFMGFLVYANSGLQLAAAIVFWVLFVVYLIVFFVTKSSSPPLLQKGLPPSFATTEGDYYQGVGDAA